MLRPLPACALCALLLGAACGGPSGTISVGWLFADGRACSGAGVTQVALSGPVSCTCDGGACGSGCRFACEAGLGGPSDGGSSGSVRVDLTGSGTLRADGFTLVGSSIYRGEERVEELGDVLVRLYFTGGP